MRQFELIYCDKDLIVVNKAPGVPCHPVAKSDHSILSLIEAVASEFPEVMSQFVGDREGGLCHRIDNDTSGIVVIARHPSVREDMRKRFHEGMVSKTYLAIVRGTVQGPLDIQYPVAHHEKNARKMIAVTAPNMRHRGHLQEAHTVGRVLLSNAEATLVRIQIGAGRRHQIRVHMAAIGHPLFGDVLYRGPQSEYLRGHALHASTIILPSGQELEAHAPAEWDDELRRLRLTN